MLTEEAGPTSLLDYGLLTAAERAEEIATAFVESPSPLNPLGVKGIGEGGAIGTPAAIANALADALGGRHIDPPFTRREGLAGAAMTWEQLRVLAPLRDATRHDRARGGRRRHAHGDVPRLRGALADGAARRTAARASTATSPPVLRRALAPPEIGRWVAAGRRE